MLPENNLKKTFQRIFLTTKQNFFAWNTSYLLSLFCVYFLLKDNCFTDFALFSQTSTWISHRYTYIPSCLKLFPISLPIPPFRLIQRPCLSFLSHIEYSCRLSILHMVTQISTLLFPQAHHLPSLSLVHKSILCVCFSVAALSISTSVPFF